LAILFFVSDVPKKPKDATVAESRCSLTTLFSREIKQPNTATNAQPGIRVARTAERHQDRTAPNLTMAVIYARIAVE